MGGRLLVPAVLAATVFAAVASAATAPDSSQMVLTATDIPQGTVSSQGRKATSVIPTLNAYARTFSGVQIGSIHLLALTNTVVVGKNATDAGDLLSELRTAVSSVSGRASLLAEAKSSFGAK